MKKGTWCSNIYVMWRLLRPRWDSCYTATAAYHAEHTFDVTLGSAFHLQQLSHVTVRFQVLWDRDGLYEVYPTGQVTQCYCKTNLRYLLPNERCWHLLYSRWSQNKKESRSFFTAQLFSQATEVKVYWLSTETCFKTWKTVGARL